MMKKLSRRLGAAFTFSALSSLAVLLAILSELESDYEYIAVIAASSVFWLFLILEQLYMWLANSARKKLERTESVRRLDGLFGAISFFKTPFGFVMDVLFIGCTVAFAVLAIGDWGRGIAQYVLLFLIVLTFRWHSIANGKNYRYKILLKRRRKKNEVND